MPLARLVRPVCRPVLRAVFAFVGVPAVGLMTGCGMGPIAASSSAVTSDAVTMSGKVHGGLQPIAGATIQLWQAGTGGNGSAASTIMNAGTPSVSTGTDGSFVLTGTYACPSPETQVFLTSVGGNPGLPSGQTNSGLVLVSPLGRCGDLTSSAFLNVNEVTTAAAAWALAPFFGTGTNPYDVLGAAASNTAGLKNAFLDAKLLVDISTGLPPTLATGQAVESAKLLSLANALASCSNSDGLSGCSPLYAAATAGGSVPSNTLAAALNIVRNPGNNVGSVYSAAGTQPPYSGGLNAAPHDWTMTLTVSGGGVQRPYGLGVDSGGNVWTANYTSGDTGSVSGFTPQGAAIGSSPFGGTVLTDVDALVIDKADNVWVANEQQPENDNGNAGGVAKFLGVSSGSPGTYVNTWGHAGIGGPDALAQDPTGNGTVLVSSLYTNKTVIFNLDGSVANANVLATHNSGDTGVVSDGAGGAWVVSTGDNTLTHILASGQATATSCCNDPDGLARDSSGNFWIANYASGSSSVSEVSGAGALVGSYTGGGVNQPSSLTVDVGNHVWVANYNPATAGTTATISELATNGTALSPAAGLGLDVRLIQPAQIVADASGNLWVANSGATNSVSGMPGNVVMFFGLATPTSTPMGLLPAAP